MKALGKSYLETTCISEFRVIQKLRQLATRLDGSMVFGWKSGPKCFGQHGVVENSDFVVSGFFTMDEALNGVATIIENEAGSSVRIGESQE
jgi:hypothetical protein